MKRYSRLIFTIIFCLCMCLQGTGYGNSVDESFFKMLLNERYAYGAEYEMSFISEIVEDSGEVSTLADSGVSDYATSIAEAAALLRQQMKQRATTIEISIKATDNILETARGILKEAMAHTGVPDEGDYIRYQYGGGGSRISHYEENGVDYYRITYSLSYYTTGDQEA